jgi:RecA-family ATPase
VTAAVDFKTPRTAPPANDDAPMDGSTPPAAPAPPPWDARVIAVPTEWYVKTPPAREWLLRDKRTGDGALAKGVVGLLAAAGGAGKSMMLAQLAVSVATGSPWLGVYEPTAIGRVLLVLAEETAEEVQRRLWRAAGAMRAAPPALGAIEAMGLHGLDCALLCAGEHGDPVETGFAAWLLERVARERYALVALDPHSRLAGRDAERTNSAATRAVQVYEAVAESGAAVVIAHHTPQWERRSTEGGQATARGVTGLVDGVRWMLHASVERAGETVDEHLREVVTVTPAKANYARQGAPVVLRRDGQWGGALVPLDDADRSLVADARRAATPAVQRATARDEERARQGREDAEAALRIATERPGIVTADLEAAICAARHCGCARARTAIAGAKLVDEPVPGRSHARAWRAPS